VLVKDVVTAGAFFHAIYKTRSILGYIILAICNSGYIHSANECFVAISQILEVWLTDLCKVGVDLLRYGVEEKALLLTGKVNSTFECWRWFGDEENEDSVTF
jgi:hypothetical protein